MARVSRQKCFALFGGGEIEYRLDVAFQVRPAILDQSGMLAAIFAVLAAAVAAQHPGEGGGSQQADQHFPVIASTTR